MVRKSEEWMDKYLRRREYIYLLSGRVCNSINITKKLNSLVNIKKKTGIKELTPPKIMKMEASMQITTRPPPADDELELPQGYPREREMVRGRPGSSQPKGSNDPDEPVYCFNGCCVIRCPCSACCPWLESLQVRTLTRMELVSEGVEAESMYEKQTMLLF